MLGSALTKVPANGDDETGGGGSHGGRSIILPSDKVNYGVPSVFQEWRSSFIDLHSAEEPLANAFERWTTRIVCLRKKGSSGGCPSKDIQWGKSHKCPFCVALFAGQRQIFILNQISGDEEKLHTNKFPSSTWCMCVYDDEEKGYTSIYSTDCTTKLLLVPRFQSAIVYKHCSVHNLVVASTFQWTT